jgi:hypothetical protein
VKRGRRRCLSCKKKKFLWSYLVNHSVCRNCEKKTKRKTKAKTKAKRRNGEELNMLDVLKIIRRE